MQWFGPNQPEVMPGSTAISVSREVLAELKDKGETQFSFRIGGLKGMAGSLLGALGQMAGGGAAGAPKETKDLANMGKGRMHPEARGQRADFVSRCCLTTGGFRCRPCMRSAPPTTA